MAYELQGQDPDEFDCGEPTPPPPTSAPPLLRRIKHLEEFSYEDDVLVTSTLPALLVLQQRLFQTTNADNQDEFFSSSDGGACVHGILDVLTSIQKESQWDLAEPYYLESIQWLQRVARFPQGMILLRSRVSPVSGGNGDFMPNAIDVAITQMHKLTVNDGIIRHG